MLENMRRAQQEVAPPTSLLAMGKLKAEMEERHRQAQLQAERQLVEQQTRIEAETALRLSVDGLAGRGSDFDLAALREAVANAAKVRRDPRFAWPMCGCHHLQWHPRPASIQHADWAVPSLRSPFVCILSGAGGPCRDGARGDEAGSGGGAARNGGEARGRGAAAGRGGG